MLVLAMEFSKGAQRAFRDAGHLQSDRWAGAERTGERPAATGGRVGIASEGGITSGCLTARTEGHSLKTE